MFDRVWILQSSRRAFFPPNPRVNYMVSLSNIVEGAIIGASNEVTNSWLQKNESSEAIFNGQDGAISIGMLLKPADSAIPDLWQFGPNTSNDDQEDNFSASIFIRFSDTPPPGVGNPIRSTAPLDTFNMEGLDAQNESLGPYYLDLRQMGGGKRYCHIKVQVAPGSNIDMIEGKVTVYLSTLSSVSNNVVFATYGVKRIGEPNDEGFPESDVINHEYYFNLEIESKAVLYAMVSPHDKGSPGSFSFEVGDPKDDADVDIEEV